MYSQFLNSFTLEASAFRRMKRRMCYNKENGYKGVKSVKKLLVPVDGSTASLNALRKAIDIGKEYGFSILIVSVVESKDVSRQRRMGRVWINDDRLNAEEIPEERLKRHATELLEAIEQRIDFKGVSHKKEVLFGEAHEVILQKAEEERVDLIVIGNRGFSRVKRFFIGSVAQRVIAESNLPVLVIHTNADF